MKLLLDLGNTRLKWALWDGATLQPGAAVAHAQAGDIAAALEGIGEVQSAWIASVAAPALDAALAAALRRRGLEAQFVRSSASACGVRSAYAQPERLGVDRFLSLIAVYAQAPAATVIASCGTALALDALAADGTHLGGLIAPAPTLMRQALLGNTARLGDIDAATIVEMAINTADAVESGTWLAATALVERFVVQARAQLGAAPELVLSGGGAQRLGGLLAPAHRIDAHLVLRGLACYADHHGALG